MLGEINPVSASAPKIKFQVNLPTTWNNKAVMFGGGGYNGTIATGTGNVPAGPTDKPTPLGRGYATFGSDSGTRPAPPAAATAASAPTTRRCATSAATRSRRPATSRGR